MVNYFKALADETRVRLLNLVLFREFNVNELLGIMNMGQSRISRHLKILTDCSLLSSRRDGLWVFYHAVKNGEPGKFIESINYLLHSSSFCAGDIARAEQLIRTGRQKRKQFFDSLASDWDQVKREILDDFDLNGEIVSRVKNCGIAADLGCGTGSLLPGLLSKADQVIGVDSSLEMLKYARRDVPDEQVSLRIGELEHLPMRDGEADCAIMNMVLHHLTAPGTGIMEAYRILKKDKSLIIADFCKHEDESMRSRYGDRWLGFSEEQTDHWLKETGFCIHSRTEFPLKRGLTIFIYCAYKAQEEEKS